MLKQRMFACAMCCALAVGLLATTAGAAITDVRINEVYADQLGGDTIEFFELYGPAGTNLTGLTILVIEGDSGTTLGNITRADTVTGVLPADGLWVVGTAGTPNPGAGNPPDQTITGLIQNGSQTYVLVTGFTGAVSNDTDTNDDGVIDASYTQLGTVIDAVAVVDNGFATDKTYLGAPALGPVLGGAVGGNPAGIARKSDGIDTNTVADWCFTSHQALPPTATGPGTDGYDPSSPGVSNNYFCDRPSASNVTAGLLTTSASPTSVPITLLGDDSFNPGPGSLSYIITSFPEGFGISSSQGSGGTLSDPNGSSIASTPYTLLSNGDVVDFTPAANASGWFQFKYKVNDGDNDSLEATVDIFIQDTGRVVITEIMYDPANTNADNAAFDSDWEWVEITNLTGSDIFLGSYMDDAMTTTNNVYFFSIPANATQVMVKPERTLAPFTLSGFLAEWSPLTSGDVIQILSVGGEGEPRLGDGGDVIRLFDSDGRLLDVVEYDNGNGWPTSNTQSSIYLKHGFINTADNDNGANWQRSVAGLCGAYASDATDSISDVGSPAVLPTQICSAAPVAQDGEKDVLKDANPGPIITLIATDGDGDPLTYSIVTGPSSGTLTDPLNGEANVTGGGVLAGDQVRYTPAPTVIGDYTFTFKANDGTADSNAATITVHVIQPGDTSVRINEVYFNQVGADTIEFYELYGPGNASLAGFSLVEIDGDGTSKGRVNAVHDLTGNTIPADGLLVVGSAATPNVDLTVAGGIQNGTGTFVLVSGFTGAVNGDIDADDDGVADSSIGTIIDSVGVNDNGATDYNYFGAPVIMTSSGGIARKTNGLDTDTTSDWCRTSQDRLPPLTGPGLDGFDAASPGVDNNYSCGGSATPPVVASAISRKTHGNSGAFDINAVGGIECRAGGPTMVIVTFDQAIQQVAGTVADVSVSSGTVSSLLVAGSSLEVSMSGATNAAPLTMSFPGIAAAADIGQVSAGSLCVRVLAGDANTDASVNIFDLIAIRNLLNQAVDNVTFLKDVTADGNINIFDLINTRNNLNQTVGACGS